MGGVWCSVVSKLVDKTHVVLDEPAEVFFGDRGMEPVGSFSAFSAVKAVLAFQFLRRVIAASNNGSFLTVAAYRSPKYSTSTEVPSAAYSTGR